MSDPKSGVPMSSHNFANALKRNGRTPHRNLGHNVTTQAGMTIVDRVSAAQFCRKEKEERAKQPSGGPARPSLCWGFRAWAPR